MTSPPKFPPSEDCRSRLKGAPRAVTVKHVTERPAERERRRLRAEYKRSERRAWEAQLPLTLADLRALLDHLDTELGVRGCDHTFAATEAWLAAHEHDVERVIEGLRTLGGGCDCEVLANVDPETHV